MALEDPLGIETDVTVGDPPEEVANSVVPELFVDRLTVSAEVVGLPKASVSSTVMDPMVALAVAEPEAGEVVKINLAGGYAVVDWTS